MGRRPPTSRAPLAPLAPHIPHRRRLRGVCSAGPTGGPPPGAAHPAGTSLDALASGAGLLRLAKKSTGDSARSRSRQGRAGEPRREPGGGAGGWPAEAGVPSPPAPRSAAGQLCLRRRAMCCVSISPCPAAKPPGAAARLTPSAPRSPRPAAPGEGLPRPRRGSRSEGATARPPTPPAPEGTTTRWGPGAGAAAPCTLRAL